MAKQENQDDQDYKARATALRLLARREHSRLELSMKLRQRRFDSRLIDEVLDEYEEQGCLMITALPMSMPVNGWIWAMGHSGFWESCSSVAFITYRNTSIR